MTTGLVVRWEPGQETIEDEDNSSARLFERSRIKALADERETVQKKTFTKWVTSHLVRVNSRIGDLYVDLRDGKLLIKLLEILSGERLPKPTKGKMRIHCLENVEKALQFLREQHVHLENLGAHDIVDGSPRLTLGLIWTIILRFQIQDIMIEEIDNKETKSAKDALLLWCQMKTAGYNNVNIRNFTTSWRDGLAFNAIIHKHRPDLIRYEQLQKSNALHNLNNAFNTAEDKLGISRLLDAEDVAVDYPDEKSIITYVVAYYHYFSRMKADSVQGRRIGKVVDNAIENEHMMNEYESLTSDLIEWIKKTIQELNDRTFENSLTGVQSQLLQFNTYRTVEKPPKFVEKGNLEILLFTLQSKMRANNQKPYFPKEGKMISDINRAWEMLEKAEHERELALREELIRQEKLEQLANRFDRKAGMRETWLSENQRLVSQDNFGYDLAAVEAATKKHEAIETDIYAYEERVQAVVSVAQELELENYHDIDRIVARKDNVLRLWEYLLELLRARRMRLELSMSLQRIFQEMIYILDWMEELKLVLTYDQGLLAYGTCLPHNGHEIAAYISLGLVLWDMLGCVWTTETLYCVLASRLTVGRCVSRPAGYTPIDPAIVVERKQAVEVAYDELLRLAADRHAKLLESRRLWQFFWEMAEEEAWIKEMEHMLSSPDLGHDLTSVELLLNQHKSRLLSEDYGKHLMSVEDLLQRHSMLEADIAVLGERIKSVNSQAQRYVNGDDELGEPVEGLRVDEALSPQLSELVQLAPCAGYSSSSTPLVRSVTRVGANEAACASILLDPRLLTRPSPQKNCQSAADCERLACLSACEPQQLVDATIDCLPAFDATHRRVDGREKLLGTMVPSRDLDFEDLDVMKHRFEGFEHETNANKNKVDTVNEIARQLVEAEHPDADAVVARQNQLNQSWTRLLELSEQKKQELEQFHGIQEFHIETTETITWIEEKCKILEETREYGDDLAGVMKLQRRMSFMERDIKAIQDKLEELEQEAARIEATNPEEARAIRERIEEIRVAWADLNTLLQDREEKLAESGNLQHFLRDLDDFQNWLTKTTTAVASADQPSDLQEAEKLLQEHQAYKQEIDGYAEEHAKLKETGDQLTANQTDPQYVFLRQRLEALNDGWEQLLQMWEQQQRFLSEALNLQVFLRDAKQAEVLLNHQDNFLMKEEPTQAMEQAEAAVKRQEAFMTTMDANDDKVNSVITFGQRLCDEGHYDADKIFKKAENIQERRNANRRKAEELLQTLKDKLELQRFLRECEEFSFWTQDKTNVAQDETYRSAKTVHSKWTRHQAFQAELDANRERLDKVLQEGERLKEEKPEFAEEIQRRMNELQQEYENLQKATQEKGQKLFDANRHVLYEQSCDDIDEWMNELETQIVQDTGNRTCQRHPASLQTAVVLESEMNMKQAQVMELETQAAHLAKLEPDNIEKLEAIEAKKTMVEARFQKLQAPLMDRKTALERKRIVYQFGRDGEDELMWIEEKMPLATSKKYGNSLYQSQILKKKHQNLRREVENHEPRILSIIAIGNQLVNEGHPQADEFTQKIATLQDRWQELRDALDTRDAALTENEKAQINLRREVENHEPRILSIIAIGNQLVNEGHPQADEFTQKIATLQDRWQELRDALDTRDAALTENEKAQILTLHVRVGRAEHEGTAKQMQVELSVALPLPRAEAVWPECLFAFEAEAGGS
ncbi:PREDICTED: spectrin beta chain-like [Priapulus caudatus]|uniref:Spectrin beta chain-like n=1 Tax=Priapulus caudatus TaxID=37621 RepID=A0ABM1DSD8_PRICU|nr:PREDICTED: spectrin beta chain-like [Priapulus caudatus]